jgi:hypothetical protein
MNVQKQSISVLIVLLKVFVFMTPVNAQGLTDSAANGQFGMLFASAVRAGLGPDSRLYNGHEYVRNGTNAKGSPYFDMDSLQTATLTYDGVFYREIGLEYDLVTDEVIIRNFSGNALISLIRGKISDFTIGVHVFRYIAPDKTTAAQPPTGVQPPAGVQPPTGFYEELYSAGTLTLLARREKKLTFPSSNDVQPKYDQTNAYFLRIDHRFYKIDSKSSLLETLKDKAAPLKKYIRQNKIRFKRHLENALIQTIGYYMQIKS